MLSEHNRMSITSEHICGLHLFEFLSVPDGMQYFAAESLVSITEYYEFSYDILLFVCNRIISLLPQYAAIIKTETLEFLDLVDRYNELYGEI